MRKACIIIRISITISGICKKCRGVMKDLENGTSESVVQALGEEMEKLALVKI